MSKSIKILRLQSGEELVAYTTVNEASYSLEKVCVILPKQDGQIGLYPFMPYSNIRDNGIEIPKESIVFTAVCAIDLEDYYKDLVDEKSNIILS